MEVRPEPIRAPRRLAPELLVAIVLLAVAAVAVGAALAKPGALNAAPDLGAVAAGAGASASPAASPAASAKPGRGNGGRGLPGILGAIPWLGANAQPGSAAGRAGGFLPDIRITAISGTKVSLESANGWTRTIDTTGVTITRAGATIAVGGLKVGDRISVNETRASDGTFTVKGLTVVLDQVSGTVTKIDAGSITVSQGGNKTATVTTTASTVYRRAGQTIARSDLAVGERLTAVGTSGADGSLAAEAVNVQPDMVFGTVTKKSGNTLTIATFGGGTATVQVTSKTTYQVAGKSNPTLADVAVNDTITAEGVKGANGVLTASAVRDGGARGKFPGANGHGPAWKGAGPSPSAATGTSG